MISLNLSKLKKAIYIQTYIHIYIVGLIFGTGWYPINVNFSYYKCEFQLQEM